MTQNCLNINFRRPQNVPSSDFLLVALANRLFEIEEVGKSEALVYVDERDGDKSTTLKFVSTSPDQGHEIGADRAQKLARWSEALTHAGLRGDDLASSDVGRAVARSIRRPTEGQSKSGSAVPFTANVSLLQDIRGITGVKNPPNFGLILEQLFSLGLNHSKKGSSRTAAEYWHEAVRHRVEIDHLAGSVDTAALSLLPSPPEQRIPVLERPASLELERMIRQSDATPMHWFARNWIQITSDEWVERLPARRWVDWASTILRHALSFGFLWQARYYATIAELVMTGTGAPSVSEFGEALDSRRDLIRWGDSSLAPGVRATTIRADLRRGERARWWFTESLDGVELSDKPLEAIAQIRGDSSLKKQLSSKLAASSDPKAFKNLWEAVRYSVRNEDPYGLVGYRGRYLLVEPGPEWIAVMASLLCGSNGRTTVGEIVQSLNLLGIRLSLSELLRTVERSGLADLAADADLAVTVRRAF